VPSRCRSRQTASPRHGGTPCSNTRAVDGRGPFTRCDLTSVIAGNRSSGRNSDARGEEKPRRPETDLPTLQHGRRKVTRASVSAIPRFVRSPQGPTPSTRVPLRWVSRSRFDRMRWSHTTARRSNMEV
jgi:hypothetical protein